MGKLAFVSVPAEADFDPVLAHLRLVLSLINLLKLLLLLRGRKERFDLQDVSLVEASLLLISSEVLRR